MEAFFLAIITVGLFFIIWDIYFAYQNVWGFNDDYLIRIQIVQITLEEWLFFSLILMLVILFIILFRIFFPKLEFLSKRQLKVLA